MSENIRPRGFFQPICQILKTDANFEKGTSEKEVRWNLTPFQGHVNNLCLNELKFRANYKELLQLIFYIIGDYVPDFGNYRLSDATSHARFISKPIYCLKICLFRM